MRVLWIMALIVVGCVSVRADLVIAVNTSKLSGDPVQLAFDFIGGPDANKITLAGFSSNGTLGASSTTGGVSGNLPGTVTLTDAIPGDFFNEYLTGLRLGTTFSFTLSATTIGPSAGAFPDAFSLFLLNPATGLSLITTMDPTGSDSLLTLNIDGSPTGNLNIYSSDDAIVTASPVSVPEPAPWALLFSSLAGLVSLVRVRASPTRH